MISDGISSFQIPAQKNLDILTTQTILRGLHEAFSPTVQVTTFTPPLINPTNSIRVLPTSFYKQKTKYIKIIKVKKFICSDRNFFSIFYRNLWDFWFLFATNLLETKKTYYLVKLLGQDSLEKFRLVSVEFKGLYIEYKYEFIL